MCAFGICGLGLCICACGVVHCAFDHLPFKNIPTTFHQCRCHYTLFHIHFHLPHYLATDTPNLGTNGWRAPDATTDASAKTSETKSSSSLSKYNIDTKHGPPTATQTFVSSLGGFGGDISLGIEGLGARGARSLERIAALGELPSWLEVDVVAPDNYNLEPYRTTKAIESRHWDAQILVQKSRQIVSKHLGPPKPANSATAFLVVSVLATRNHSDTKVR